LPLEILKMAVQFLSPRDAVRVKRASKKLNSQLDLVATDRLRILDSLVRRDSDFNVHLGFELPGLSRDSSIHTTILSMKWQDQGWGNRKSRVIITAEMKGEEYDAPTWSNFEGRRVIFRSSHASHTEERLKISFHPRTDETYSLWFIVGGGGGHCIHLKEIELRTIAFDGPFVKALAFCSESNLISSWAAKSLATADFVETLLRTALHLVSRGTEIPPPLLLFFDQYGLSAEELSVELIKSILHTWKRWNAACRHYVGNGEPRGNNDWLDEDEVDYAGDY